MYFKCNKIILFNSWQRLYISVIMKISSIIDEFSHVQLSKPSLRIILLHYTYTRKFGNITNFYQTPSYTVLNIHCLVISKQLKYFITLQILYDTTHQTRVQYSKNVLFFRIFLSGHVAKSTVPIKHMHGQIGNET